MMYYEALRRRVADADAGQGCYYPPDHPKSKYTDENGFLNIIVPGALTERGRRMGARTTHICINVPRARLPDDHGGQTDRQAEGDEEGRGQ